MPLKRFLLSADSDGEDGRYGAASLDGNPIQFGDREGFFHETRSFFAEEQRDAVVLGSPFETRCEIDRIAEGGIVEALVRTHVADDALAGVDADADSQRLRGPPLPLRLSLQFLVDPRERCKHVERCAHRVNRMVGVVKRRIPEGHEAVADIFVDGSALFQHRIRQRRQ
ncbi:hypothetical protein D9M70_521910 [compost metagenome]